MTDIRFAFETMQHDHDATTFWFSTEGASLTRQGFAEECDINVLMTYGRYLRPALYSSLRSSPSHPNGVSVLRATIAIAKASFAAFSRKSPRVPRVCWFGSWALGTSDRGGQDKANCRSRTRRLSNVEKPLSAHWFLESPRLAVNDVSSWPYGAFRASQAFTMRRATALADFDYRISAFSYDYLRIAASFCDRRVAALAPV